MISEQLHPDVAEFEKEYRCFRDGIYVGDATFIDDENIGPAFIKMSVDAKGRLIHEVIIPHTISLK